jgi:hypothetical protein
VNFSHHSGQATSSAYIICHTCTWCFSNIWLYCCVRIFTDHSSAPKSFKDPYTSRKNLLLCELFPPLWSGHILRLHHLSHVYLVFTDQRSDPLVFSKMARTKAQKGSMRKANEARTVAADASRAAELAQTHVVLIIHALYI